MDKYVKMVAEFLRVKEDVALAIMKLGKKSFTNYCIRYTGVHRYFFDDAELVPSPLNKISVYRSTVSVPEDLYAFLQVLWS